jgi:hypothetical protein
VPVYQEDADFCRTGFAVTILGESYGKITEKLRGDYGKITGSCGRLTPIYHQPSNQREWAHWAQRRHLPVEHLCVLGVLCGYDNTSVSRAIGMIDNPVLHRVAQQFGLRFQAQFAH